MTAKEKIQHLFEDSPDMTIREIVDRLGISKQMAHIAVKEMVEESLLEKLGRAPKTVYRYLPNKPKIDTPLWKISSADEAFLQENFLNVTESGNLLTGPAAFENWCRQRKQPLPKTLEEYRLTKKKYEGYYDNEGLVNGMEKLKNTRGYNTIWLDSLYYLDFYAIERFGKTKLGTLLHFAKQGQNRYLMRILMEMIDGKLKTFLTNHHADAVGFVPPTIRRELQLMKFIQSSLNLPMPVLDIKKISGIIPVPQKSLSKLEERIRNAENTFAITDRRVYQHVVLIDDAVGSGATLNEVAGKIKSKGVAHKVTGLAIVGSFKGFDVITDI
jgi:hypothetical protein